jgi:hypothetical protein
MAMSLRQRVAIELRHRLPEGCDEPHLALAVGLDSARGEVRSIDAGMTAGACLDGTDSGKVTRLTLTGSCAVVRSRDRNARELAILPLTRHAGEI